LKKKREVENLFTRLPSLKKMNLVSSFLSPPPFGEGLFFIFLFWSTGSLKQSTHILESRIFIPCAKFFKYFFI